MCSTTAFAQNQITENYLVTGPYTDYGASMKYSYKVSDDGDRIKHGPITISGNQNEQYGNVTITGKYQLNATAANGMLNGAMTVSAKYHGVQQLFRGQNVEDYAYSLSGSFINGIPNGTFTAKATNYGSSSATYKKGVLVGAYSVNEILDDRIINIKGTLSETGKMIGEWRIEDKGDVSVWEFVNGIRIRTSTKSQESTPKQIEMAKKYAANAISVEELEKEGFFPVQDSIRLGDYASDLYFLKYIADWDKLPKCSFGTSYWVKYSYLYNILPIPDNKFETILETILSDLREYGENLHSSITYDKKAKAYVTEYREENRGLIRRRFTDEQLNKVKEAIDLYCREQPIQSLGSLFSELQISHQSGVPSPHGIVEQFESIKTDTDLNSLSYKYQSFLDKVESIGKIATAQLEGKEKTADGNYYMIPKKWSLPFYVKYFPVSVLEEFLAFEKEVKEFGDVLEQRIEESRIASEQRLAEESAEKQKTTEIIGETEKKTETEDELKKAREAETKAKAKKELKKVGEKAKQSLTKFLRF